MSRMAPPVSQRPELAPERAAPVRVQCRRRLVEEERRRVAREGEGDCEPTALATREATGLSVGDLGEAEPPEHVVTRR